MFIVSFPIHYTLLSNLEYLLIFQLTLSSNVQCLFLCWPTYLQNILSLPFHCYPSLLSSFLFHPKLLHMIPIVESQCVHSSILINQPMLYFPVPNVTLAFVVWYSQFLFSHFCHTVTSTIVSLCHRLVSSHSLASLIFFLFHPNVVISLMLSYLRLIVFDLLILSFHSLMSRFLIHVISSFCA